MDEIAEAIDNLPEETTETPVVEEAVTEEVATDEVAEEVEEVTEPTLAELMEQAIADAEPKEEVAVEPEAEEVSDDPEPAEPELPEYTKQIEGEVDLTNEMEVEALNYWGGGPRAEWTRHPEQMTDEQKEVFKKHQRAFDKSKVQPVAEKKEPTRDELAEATKDLAALLRGDTESFKKKYAGQTDSIEPEKPKEDNETLRKVADAIDSGDTDAIMNAFNEYAKDVRTQAVIDAETRAKETALQSVSERQQADKYERWISKVAEDNKRLVERDGSAYTQYTEKIQGILELTERGIPNPLTGTMVENVEDAYDLVRKVDSGGGQRVANVRPSPAVAPPAGSSEGSGSDITDKDLALSTKDFMSKAWDKAEQT